MKIIVFKAIIAILFVCGGGHSCHAQIGAGQSTSDPTRYSDALVERWQVGAVIQAANKPATSISIAIPVPTDWPEQSVAIVEEDVSSAVRNIKYQTLEDGVRRMTATIPSIRAGAKIKVLLTFEVQVRKTSLPEKTDHLVIPTKVARDVKRHLNASRLINHRKTDVKRLVKELAEDQPNAWKQVQSFYDYIRQNIEFVAVEEAKGAVITLKRSQGNGEDMVNLFVAMCRAFKIPARIVWVDGTQYAEFYLEDDEGNGAWYPCQLHGNPEFGKMTTTRVIMQKGDNIKVPGKNERQRLVREIVTGSARGAKPKVTFVRRLVPH